jgi:hypothetical protein
VQQLGEPMRHEHPDVAFGWDSEGLAQLRDRGGMITLRLGYERESPRPNLRLRIRRVHA